MAAYTSIRIRSRDYWSLHEANAAACGSNVIELRNTNVHCCASPFATSSLYVTAAGGTRIFI